MPTHARLTETQIEAMDAYDALINDHDNQVEMALRPGDIQFVNNYHVLHGRRRYVDDTDTGRVRWLKRLWLATDILGPEDRPARFQRRRRDGPLGLAPNPCLTSPTLPQRLRCVPGDPVHPICTTNRG